MSPRVLEISHWLVKLFNVRRLQQFVENKSTDLELFKFKNEKIAL